MPERLSSIESRMKKTFANDPRTPASQRAMSRLIALGACLLLGAPSGNAVHVARVGGGAPTAGKAWTVKLAVRPTSFGGRVQLVATGPGRVTARARGGKGSYRARLVLPKTGAWTLTAR